MAAKKTNPWKIGLFVALGVAALVVGLFWAGVQRLRRPSFPRITYFDESVQGLDVGAPVKMRGVTLGTVSDITIAEDKRLVEVTAEFYVDVWIRLGLGTEAELRSASRALPDDLRVQLSSTGITGEKFLLVDFFTNPGKPPELLFSPPYNYVPSTPSTLKSLEGGVILLAELLPQTLARLDKLAATADKKLGAIDSAGLSANALSVLENAERFLGRADRTLDEMNVQGLEADVRRLVDRLTRTAESAEQFLVRLEAPDGALKGIARDFESLAGRADSTMATIEASLGEADVAATTKSLRQTSDAYRAVATDAAGLSGEARETLARLRETLAAVQALARLLEQQPGALLRGHATEFRPGDDR